MSKDGFKPYVPADSNLPELTVKSLLLGVIMACILGAANAYLGLRAGMTVAATFPAAVVAMAILRVFKGSVLEENIARTTASVGEALVAGAIFTIPAFLIAGVWDTIDYWESTLLMLVGGILGVLFVIILRRTLVEEADLPFPESVAASEIVKAGQGGETGAKFVFGAMGLAGVLEFLRNPNGLQMFTDSVGGFFTFAKSKIQVFGPGSTEGSMSFTGGLYMATPAASPAFLGVGYIIGPRLSLLTFSGGVLGWLLLIPLAVYFNVGLEDVVASGRTWNEVAIAVWKSIVRPIAVGAMIVGAFYTLFNLRGALASGIGKSIADMRKLKAHDADQPSRLEVDIPFNYVFIGIGVMIIPMFLLYWYFSQSLGGAVLSAGVMAVAGFLFAAVAGYLVGIIGSSSNPISGLTLSTLIVAALLMVIAGVKGNAGVAAVLGVATVVCCSSGIAGDMMQDLKVGHILGGTPWRMELGEMIGVVVAAFVLVLPLSLLHAGTPGGIGGAALPAPQAGLMALMSQGIVGGDMAWPLVIMGMLFGVGLIMVGTPSPMIVAVGMYLPFATTFAIGVGGVIRYILDRRLAKRGLEGSDLENGANTGILLASGMVAGEALTGVLLAGLYVAGLKLPTISTSPILGFLVFGLLAAILIGIPLRNLPERLRQSA